jgi:hypothetical protein
MSIGSSIRVQLAAAQVSFGEPSLMKYVDVFSTMLLEAHASSCSYWLSIPWLNFVDGVGALDSAVWSAQMVINQQIDDK